ncbi:MAG: hypothetical protein R3E87_09140 [Burkholderiaceae bacterium]
MIEAGDDIAIIGFGGSEIVRRSDRGITAFGLDAAIAALADAGLDRDEIDGYVGAPWAPAADAVSADGADELTFRTLLPALGLENARFAQDLHKAFATDMVQSAALALKAGQCRYVLGVRAMANLNVPAPGAGAQPEQAFGVGQYSMPYGYHIAGARFATRLRRYMADHGVTREDLFETVSLHRRHARLNPLAIWRDKPLSRDQYLEAPMIASPHCLFDCDMPVYGAAAFVMARAADVPAGARPAWVSGWSGQYRPHDVFERSGLSPVDVSACQLYDGFSSMVYEWLEAFGFVPAGQAARFIRDGHAEIGARLPLNTFGGSLGEGRLHGIGHLREAYLQVSGRAGERQLRQADHCLVQIGPYDLSSFVMLSAERRAG